MWRSNTFRESRSESFLSAARRGLPTKGPLQRVVALGPVSRQSTACTTCNRCPSGSWSQAMRNRSSHDSGCLMGVAPSSTSRAYPADTLLAQRIIAARWPVETGSRPWSSRVLVSVARPNRYPSRTRSTWIGVPCGTPPRTRERRRRPWPVRCRA